MANAIGGSKIFIPRPPAKGSFPLDHDGDCKDLIKQYLDCLNKSKTDASYCRKISEKYLQCRMDHDLMAKEDFKNLGFDSDKQN